MHTATSIQVHSVRRGGDSSKWEWKFPLAVWFVSGLLTQALGILTWRTGWIPYEDMRDYYAGMTPIMHAWQGWAYGIWQRWDAIHYQHIAQYGYDAEVVGGFFPLYPVLGRMVSSLTNTHALVGLLAVSNLAFAGALILLYRLTSRCFSPDLARFATVFAALVPYAYFFHAPYTESLALLLILIAIYAAYNRRWTVVAAAGLLAGLTRATVFPLAGALLWIAWEEEKPFPFSRGVLRYLAAATPLLGNTLFFQWLAVRGFPTYFRIKEIYWAQSIVPPWQAISDLLAVQRSAGLTYDFWVNLAAFSFVIALNVWGWKRLPGALRIYQVGIPAMMFLNGGPHTFLYSFVRFALLMFPNYVLMAAWAGTPARRLVTVGGFIFLHLLFVTMFFLWAWTG